MKWVVISKFYDNGKVEAASFHDAETQNVKFYKAKNKNVCDTYEDTFDNAEEAEAYKRDCYLA